jgi:plastocyanin
VRLRRVSITVRSNRKDALVRRHLFIPLAVVAAGTLLAACGNDHSAHPTVMDDAHLEAMDDHHQGGHGTNTPVAAGARQVPVIADDLAFDPAEITAVAGEDLAIELTSVDILHDFTIDELDAHVAADRGETATGGFTADEPGRYTYYCAVAGHREAGMEGTLVVEAPDS